jgi:hypothetical protein
METSLIKRLPMALISKIFNYTYSPQPKLLMEDIRNYHITLEFMKSLYTPNGPFSFVVPHYIWYDIYNEIWGFMNEYYDYKYGRLDSFYLLWEKMEKGWKKNMFPPVYSPGYPEPLFNKRRPASWYRIDCYITRCLLQKTEENCCRIIWGVLSTSSRNFICQRSIEARELKIQNIINVENIYD